MENIRDCKSGKILIEVLRNQLCKYILQNLMPKVKIANLMELPPSTLTDGILTRGTGEIQYAAPLLELWMRSIQLLPDLHHGESKLITFFFW